MKNNIEECYVHEVLDTEGKSLYYEIRTRNGTIIGNAFPNIFPIDGDHIISLTDAKEIAYLWASAPKMIKALRYILQAKTKTNAVSLLALSKLIEEIRAIAYTIIKNDETSTDI